ncbi:MAG TPA: hypothetical protein VMX57_02425 [Planctomycetota bacterium]|nr:hypothetical protein [Planctomycetota bacterium]
MTRSLCVLLLLLTCVLSAGCSDGSQAEIERLQKERGRQDETLRQLNGELFALRESFFRLSQQHTTLGAQFEAARAQVDDLTRQRDEAVGQLEWTNKRLTELEATVGRQADELAKSPDENVRLAELGRTVNDLRGQIEQFKTRLSAVEAERDRLRKVCRENYIDPATGTRTPPPPPTTSPPPHPHEDAVK